jgi:hypothetical protein
MKTGSKRKYMDFQTPDWVGKYMVDLLPDGIQTVLEPTPGDGNLVRMMGRYEVTAPEDFWILNGRWDAIVMNPPFSPMVLGYEILFRCMEMSDVIVALMPWLVMINSERRTKQIWDWGLKSVTHLPRRAFAGARVQCCVLFMTKGYVGSVELKRY